MSRTTVTALLVSVLASSGWAWAQGSSDTREDRPAITSYWGDTGLWFVPTAEVLKSRGWAFGVYRTEQDFKQGRTDVEFYPLTFAIGAGSRVELFGAARTVTAIDRDTRPLFAPATTSESGLVNDYPFVREGWTDRNFGDAYVGAKFNLMSEYRRQPMALAFRATVKLPTAGEDNVGTGQFDYVGDIVLSKEIDGVVEFAGYGGYIFRGDPTGVRLSDGVRWGLGAAFGARSSFRFTTEVYGEEASDDALLTSGALVGIDGSIPPIVTNLESPINGAAGVTWQHPNGVLLGIGTTYRPGIEGRSGWGLQLRLGFHSGVSIFVPPPPPPPPPAPPRVEAPPPPPPPVAAAPPPANRPPTVRAQCDPCRVEVGQSATIRATAQDPDGDALSTRWSVAAGTITDSRATTTQWRAETAPGTVVLTVTAEDSRGGTASDKVSIEVAPLRVLADVQFDLDKATLRPDALRTLTEALKQLNDTPTIHLHIEGYASPEGTPEYNKALSQRRAVAVREYLTGRGIDPSRLTVTSYGEERLKYDTSQEATRALNRRAALIIDPTGR
jgi:outer membrane protein OmpA-like peptidoglycan-associated protein